jgi:hypothetical protein
MNIPRYSAEASIYRSTINYHLAWAAGEGSDFPVEAVQLMPQLPLPLPNGNGGCKPHLGPCNIPDPTCASGFSRLICGVDCECDTFCCTKPKTCTPCNAQGFQTCCVGTNCTTQACTSCGACQCPVSNQQTCCTGGNCTTSNC